MGSGGRCRERPCLPRRKSGRRGPRGRSPPDLFEEQPWGGVKFEEKGCEKDSDRFAKQNETLDSFEQRVFSIGVKDISEDIGHATPKYAALA